MVKNLPRASDFETDPDLDPRAFATELVENVLAGTTKVFDVRRIIIAIKNPSVRLKVDYEFRRIMRERMGIQGIDRWEAYTNSLHYLRSKFKPE